MEKWQQEQQKSIIDIHEIKKQFPLLNIADNVNFNVKITPYYLSLIDKKNPNDVLAKIVLPSTKELNIKKEELDDPIGDKMKNKDLNNYPISNLTHRYPDRVLIYMGNVCSSYCRYCFRKNLLTHKPITNKEIEDIISYIKKHKEIREVILSGGDPLMNDDKKLFTTLQKIKTIPHIKTIRIHTRMPIYNPYRITNDFIKGIKKLQKPLTIIIHAVHERELTDTVKKKLKLLQSAGVILLNQTPLLKGINDTVEIQTNLNYRLLECGVLPHYLHYLDLAKGTSHFRTSLKDAQKLMKDLRGHIGGHLIPKLILDIPNGYGKIQLEESFIKKIYKKDNANFIDVESPVIKGKILKYKEVLDK
ncbi:MAG: KamA family radical SAM protein [Alphaproteobacteria bacterium]